MRAKAASLIQACISLQFRSHLIRKERRPDEWEPPIEHYNPYGLGQPIEDMAKE
jgi:hypothetical protein